MTTHWDEVVNQTSIIFSIGCLILSVLYGFGVLSIRKPNFSEITIAEFETEVPQSTVVITSLEPETKSKPKHKTSPKKKKVKKKKKPSKLQQDCILTLTSLGEKKTQAKKIVDSALESYPRNLLLNQYKINLRENKQDLTFNCNKE